MTEMRTREVRVNLILATTIAALGLIIRLLGAIAFKKGLFLPEYALTFKGVGGTILAIGLLWLGLALIKRALLPTGRERQ